MYLLAFVAKTAYKWGAHMDFSDPSSEYYVYGMYVSNILVKGFNVSQMMISVSVG